MWHLQRTVLAEAILRFFPSIDEFACHVMARIAEPPLSAAVEEGDRTAKHAFPVNIIGTVSLHTNVGANAHFPDQARPANEILPPRGILHAQLLLTVDQSSKVRLLALRALKEAYLCLCKRHQVVEVEVAWGGHSRVFVQALLFTDLHRLNLDFAPEDVKLLELIVDLVDMLDIDGLLAVGAAHEGESDPQGAPLVLKQFKNAIRVEDVSA